MVMNGFSLFDIRKLYIDELYSYYQELFYALEQKGEIKEGTYDSIVSKNSNADNSVNLLRKQLFNSIANKNKTDGQ